MKRKHCTPPSLIRIETLPETVRLMRAEEKRNDAIQVAARELAKVLGHKEHEYWTKTIPQALFDILETYEPGAALAAARAFVAWRLKRDAEQGIESAPEVQT